MICNIELALRRAREFTKYLAVHYSFAYYVAVIYILYTQIVLSLFVLSDRQECVKNLKYNY